MDDIDSSNETEVLIISPGHSSYSSINSNTKKEEDNSALTLDEAIEMTGVGRFHAWLLLVLAWVHCADALGYTSMSYVMPPASCELDATDLDLSLITTMGLVGMLVGSYVCGTLADTHGRLPALVLCQACNSLFTVGSAASQSLWVLTLTKALSGFGLGGSTCVIFTYAIEFLPMKNRGRYIISVTAGFSAGLLIVAGLAWLIIPHEEWSWSTGGFTFNSWRLFLLITGVPPITSVPLLLTLPESPRYLVKANKMSKAKKVIKFMYEKNKNSPPLQDDFEIQRLSNNEGGNVLKKIGRTMLDIFTTPEIRKRFLLSSTILSSLSFSYYGLVMWFPIMIQRMDESNATSVCGAPIAPSNKTKCDNTDQTSVYIDTFIQAVANIPGHVVYLLLIDTVGRKLLLGSSLILNAVSVFCLWFISSQTGSVVMSCGYIFISTISWDTVALALPELYPTSTRSTAVGLQWAVFDKVAGITGNIVMGALLSVDCTVPILLTAGLLAVGGILTYKLPNTTNTAIN